MNKRITPKKLTQRYDDIEQDNTKYKQDNKS